MSTDVLLVRVRPPLYSVRHVETYQTASSYPLLPPSTIMGAVGLALASMNNCRGSVCEGRPYLELAREYVGKARDVAVGPLVKSTVVLRRSRGVLEERRLPRSLEEIRGFSDAMVREYVFLGEKVLLVVPRRHSRKLEKALWLLERLGDTESLVSVRDVAMVEAEECEAPVNVVVRASVVRGGRFVAVRMHDEEGKEDLFALPLRAVRGGVYEQGDAYVDRPTLCAGPAAFPSGNEW